MKRNLIEIYALAACLITLVWSVVVTGIGAYGVIRIAAPDVTVEAYSVGRYRSNENYVEYMQSSRSGEANVKLTDDEVTKRRATGMQDALEEERRSGKRDLIRNLLFLFINVAVFIPHWLLAKRSRSSAVV